MRIEILYVPGCPNYHPTLERIREVLASESVGGEIHGDARENRSAGEGFTVSRFSDRSG